MKSIAGKMSGWMWSDATIITTSVEVEYPDGSVSWQNVVFGSSKFDGAKYKGIRDMLNEDGTVVITANSAEGELGKGHAEGAAARLADSEELQREVFKGGKIRSVGDVMSTIRICSEKCARDLTRFKGDSSFKFKEDDWGQVNGMRITDDFVKQYREQGALGRTFEALAQMIFQKSEKEGRDEPRGVEGEDIEPAEGGDR
ncbi:MAG: hypothetical protein AUG49_22460 [Catenulispora sp. 13_1_20CM_3_70_7]|nr:MAG: hypothetical protein AUG49_22460 [Catenulispora sp. 13_1_20CM_3_70_7]